MMDWNQLSGSKLRHLW